MAKAKQISAARREQLRQQAYNDVNRLLVEKFGSTVEEIMTPRKTSPKEVNAKVKALLKTDAELAAIVDEYGDNQPIYKEATKTHKRLCAVLKENLRSLYQGTRYILTTKETTSFRLDGEKVKAYLIETLGETEAVAVFESLKTETTSNEFIVTKIA